MSTLVKKDQKKATNQFLDFDQLAHKKYHYDQKKATEQSIKQEQYIHDLKKAQFILIISYDQQKLEIEPLFQKVELLQIERKQLMDEIEQYKISQMEILKKYECEYQEKDKLNKECAKLKQQIQAQQKMQMPKEFQEKQCNQLKETLFVTIKDIMHDFLDNYNHIMGCADESGISGSLLDELLQQIDDSILMFVNCIGTQQTKQFDSEEIQHLKDQIEKTLQTVSNLSAENQDLSTALDIEKQHKEKIINQRNTQQQLINQLQNQLETITNEKKHLEQEMQEVQMKNLEFQHDISRVNEFKDEENEKLKSEFIDSINELQKQISKLQFENTKLTSFIETNAKQQNKDAELLNEKVRELESKLNQETIKFEQKSREMVRIEKEQNQYKVEATKLFEENSYYQQQLELIKEKRKQDKEVLEKQKEKCKKLELQMQQSEIDLQKKIAQLEEQIKQLTQLQAKDNNYLQQLTLQTEALMEKEIQLSKLDQLVTESTQKINEQKQQIVEMKVQINSLEQELQQQISTNQQHQERRANAFSEINRLEQQNQIQKQVNYLQHKFQRINDQDLTIKQLQSEVQELLKQANANSQQNTTPSHNKSASKTSMFEVNNLDSSRLSEADSSISKTAKATSMILNGLNYFKLRPLGTIQQAEDPERKLAEQALQKQAKELKSNLEQLYKSFLSIVFQNQVDDEKFLKFERQINECVKKTQDLNDNIEDFF